VLPLDATSFENGYRTREEVVCFAVGEESVTPVYSAFRLQFHTEPPSQASIYTWYKKFERKDSFAKERVLAGLLCHTAMGRDGLASNASHKNQVAERSVS
jgi:hypothetical protein